MPENYLIIGRDNGSVVLTVPVAWPFLARLRDRYERKHYKTEGVPGDSLWEQAQAYARWMSGALCETMDILDSQLRYVVTMCGGSPYWIDPASDGPMHQIGSDGWCWDCFHNGRGFVRHPVTPEEVGGDYLEALPTRHGDPACEACGLGYLRPAIGATAGPPRRSRQQRDRRRRLRHRVRAAQQDLHCSLRT
jgi:hypothetical protein